MAKVTSTRQLEIWECRTEDGGVGLMFGDGPIFMGYDAEDLERLLAQVFIGAYDVPPFTDGELYDLAQTYLDHDAAQERRALLDGDR